MLVKSIESFVSISLITILIGGLKIDLSLVTITQALPGLVDDLVSDESRHY